MPDRNLRNYHVTYSAALLPLNRAGLNGRAVVGGTTARNPGPGKHGQLLAGVSEVRSDQRSEMRRYPAVRWISWTQITDGASCHADADICIGGRS
jgi:hypothetical protein